MRTLERLVIPAILLMGGATPLAAQAAPTYEACYVPDVGAIYLINRTGLPSACLASTHIAVSWTVGGLADSAVTESKLAFDPATQAELDAFIAGLTATGTINTAGNPMDWTQLKNVPAEFADGVDNTGGTPSDLVCTDCVGTTDLAAAAVTAAQLATGVVAVGHLAFDPTTQAELDAFLAGLAAAGTINTAGNPVDWTQLKGVPAGFADGVDNSGGTPSDLVCTGCVGTTDLAAAAVTAAQLATGVVAVGHLAFDPATQPELDTHAASADHDGRYFTETELSAAGTINTAGNPLDWTQLKNVPADFADGVDNSGGTPSDLVCTGCVGTTDLAAAAVTAAQLATGVVAVGHLAFDPGTQTELDAHAASADHDGRYFTETELSAAGTINTTSNPMDWTQLKNVPADFADGVDNTGSGVTDHGALTGLIDDDHPAYVLADGVRSTTNGFALTGTFGSGTIPISGAGTRLMWYPGKAAFRAGNINGTQWEDANVGVYSTAMGWNTLASGSHSTAMGRSTIATGNYSTALGAFTTASSDYSTAMGRSTIASGGNSTAMGAFATASGDRSTAMGGATTAQAYSSLAIGRYNVLAGDQSQWLATDPLFVAGNGASSSSRSNGLTLYKNGDLDIAGTLTAGAFVGDGSGLTNLPSGVTDHGGLTGLVDDDHPQYLLAGVRDATNGFALTGTFGSGTIPISGAGTRLMWYPGKAAFRAGFVTGTQWDDADVGQYSTAMGYNTTASGPASTAMGYSTTASGAYSTASGHFTNATGMYSTAMGRGTAASASYSTAMGYANAASGTYSTAMGYITTASGNSSTAMGSRTTASGNSSTAMGTVTTAQAFGSLVIGRYNVVSGDQANWVATDPLFVAGNGASGATSNALTLLKNGNLTIAGTLTENSDIRLKEDIEPLSGALDGVLGLTPIRYRFREGTGHPTERQIGLSAQEVEQAFPELVSRDSEGYLSVAYTNLAAVLVRAMQEQQAEIATFHDEATALRAEVAALRAQITALITGRAERER